VDLTTIGV
jgi:hypothetical protein